ncbi:glycosyltransferase [Terricaulis sp.]|uniref:glycosyltransferase n=1 Tax=Terricaulis sp. TaxID=2768686 RepID=UPI0037837810
MKILQVAKFYPPAHGGIERVVQGLSEGAAALGHDVRVICFHERGGADCVENLASNLEVRRYRPDVRVGNIAASVRYLSDVQRFAREADVVHLHEPYPTGTFAGLRLPGLTARIVTWHADVPREGPVKLALEAMQEQLCARVDRIICGSRGLADASRILTRFRERVSVVPLALPLASFDPARLDSARVSAARERIGGRFALAVGRLVYYKGFDLLIDAAARTGQRVAIIGEGPLEGALRARAEAVGVGDRVIFLKGVSDADLPAWYAASDYFVLPSTGPAEAYGLVQVEAMASGRPVINTALPTGVPEVSLDGVTGLTVPPSDLDALTHAMERLSGDDALRGRLGIAARRRAVESFSLEQVARRHEEIYAEAIRARRGEETRSAA